MKRQKIYVLDDDTHMRDGLDAFLSPDFEVHCFDTALPFLAALENGGYADCILLDLRLPEIDGFQVLSALKKSGNTTPIVFMSGDAEKADVIEAWRGGAADFVLKPFSADEIRNSIDTLLQCVASNAGGANSNLPITPREAQVLLLLGQGLHQHEIGKRLGLSLRTVKMYRSFLKDKLGLNSLVEVARFCDRHRPAIAMKAGVVN